MLVLPSYLQVVKCFWWRLVKQFCQASESKPLWGLDSVQTIRILIDQTTLDALLFVKLLIRKKIRWSWKCSLLDWLYILCYALATTDLRPALNYTEMWRNLNNGPDAGNGFSCRGQVIFFIYFITTALGPFRSLMGHNIIRWYLYSRLPIFDHFLPLDGPY